MTLERAKWTGDQLPAPEVLALRISTYPELSMGAFCNTTGECLASLFLKPINSKSLTEEIDWQKCSEIVPNKTETHLKSLFGISLSSIDSYAADRMFAYFYGYILKHGYRSVYLGSPIPGYKRALERENNLDVKEYVYRKNIQNSWLPFDPQLYYYHKRGFRHIVSVQKDYFPHAASFDYGVIIEARVPLRQFSLIWKLFPQAWLQSFCLWVLEFTHQLNTKTPKAKVVSKKKWLTEKSG